MLLHTAVFNIINFQTQSTSQVMPIADNLFGGGVRKKGDYDEFN